MDVPTDTAAGKRTRRAPDWPEPGSWAGGAWCQRRTFTPRPWCGHPSACTCRVCGPVRVVSVGRIAAMAHNGRRPFDWPTYGPLLFLSGPRP